MQECHFDVETRSTVDLRRTGAEVYFEHPSTDFWCFAYVFGDGMPQAWWRGLPMPEDIQDHIAEGGLLVSHNATFEWLGINKILAPRYGWPTIKFDQMECTAAMAAALALPRPLDQVGAALGLDVRKDEAGKKLMMMMSKPRRIEGPNISWWDEQIKLDRLVDYCVVDVLTEREAHRKMKPLSPNERRVWQLDHVINQRGVHVDLKSVRHAKVVVDKSMNDLQKELQILTDFTATTVGEVKRIGDWLRGQGLDMDSLDKRAVKDALAVIHDPKLRRVLEIRQEGSKSSNAKLERFEEGVGEGGRIRGLLMYHGAGTGRWTGMRLQPHNFPRPTPEWDAEAHAMYFDLLPKRDNKLLDMVFGSTVTATSNALKGFITAEPGSILYAGDFSNIEGRVLAWLAGEKWKVRAFEAFDRGEGPDIYKMTAAGILSLMRGTNVTPADVTKHERQGYGKVPELACGYQGGVVAFQTMAKNYDVTFTDEAADTIKTAWRQRHPRTKTLWYDVERTAAHAVHNPGQIFRVEPLEGDPYQRIEFLVKSNILWCRLPGGRVLAYMDPKIREVLAPWGEKKDAVTYMGVDSVTRRWMRFAGYGGLWVENIVQAVARDVMVFAMFRLEAANYPIVLTVHDEILSETPEDFGSVEEFEDIMRIVPPCYAGLPVAVDAHRFFRYQKGD